LDLKYGWNGPRGHRWNGNTKSFEPIEMEKMTMKEPWEKELDRHDGDDFRAKQPKMIPNPLWCERCDGRGYLVADAEWEPYAVQCSACADRRPAKPATLPRS